MVILAARGGGMPLEKSFSVALECASRVIVNSELTMSGARVG
jgi:hypothetical protein